MMLGYGAGRSKKREQGFLLFVLVESVFWALVGLCSAAALQRIAGALKLRARVEALDEFGDAFTVEEREIVISRIKQSSLGCAGMRRGQGM